MGDQGVLQTTKKGDQLTAPTVKVGVSGTHHLSGLNSDGSPRKNPASA
jgi:hypothetical protein